MLKGPRSPPSWSELGRARRKAVAGADWRTQTQEGSGPYSLADFKNQAQWLLSPSPTFLVKFANRMLGQD